jgi:hypothetical protein
MSYSFEGSFRTKESARCTVMKDPGLPDVVRAVLVDAINALSYDTDDRYLYVKAVGHQMEANCNSYERTSAELLVEPRYFSPAPTYGRTTA